MSLKGTSGKKYALGESIGGGGEGTVHRIIGDKDIVAKVYKDSINLSDKEEKIEAMVSMSGSKGLEYTTWPKDMIYDSKGRFKGFVMNIVPAHKKINEIYETSSEIKYNWQSKVSIAYNLCTVVNSVHSIGQCCGDFNPNNICVDTSCGSVYLIDTDSFHITHNNKTYRCGVGMPAYLPKEIQERMSVGLDSMELPTFTKETDDFALAIHIFQILMNGCHPFTLSKARSNESIALPQIDRNIINGTTAFFGTDAQYDVPLYAPNIDSLPQYLNDLFRRAFVESYSKGASVRPDAKEWMNALLRLSKETIQCTTNYEHSYYKNSPYCPWCSIDRNMAGMTRMTPVRPAPRRPTNVIGTTVTMYDVTYRFDAGFATVVGCKRNINGIADILDEVVANGVAFKVKGIDDRAFKDCRYLRGVRIPNAVEFIGDEAFYHCYKLTDLELPEALERIGDRAFFWCNRLERIYIPEKVRHIGESVFAFSGCSIDVSEDNENFTSEDGVLYSKEKDVLLCVPIGCGQFVLPDSVRTIEKNAMSSNPDTFVACNNNEHFTCIDGSLYDKDCKILIHAYNGETINIPETVERIGEHACHECEFTSIDLPKGLKEIGPHAFWGCYSLPNVNLPKGLETIEYGAFYRCSSITSVTIPNTVETVEDNAFWGCSNLLSATINDGVGSIGHNAFRDCSRLRTVNVPGGTSMETDSFPNTMVMRR